MREFLEKNYTDEAIETDDLTIKLVIKALLEVRPFHIPSVTSPCMTALTSSVGIQENLCACHSREP